MATEMNVRELEDVIRMCMLFVHNNHGTLTPERFKAMTDDYMNRALSKLFLAPKQVPMTYNPNDIESWLQPSCYSSVMIYDKKLNTIIQLDDFEYEN